MAKLNKIISDSKVRKYLKLEAQMKKMREEIAQMRKEFIGFGPFESDHFKVSIHKCQSLKICQVQKLIEKFGRKQLSGFITEYYQEKLYIRPVKSK